MRPVGGRAVGGCAINGVKAGPSPAGGTPPAATALGTTSPTSPRPRTEKWIALQVGECVADLPPADLSRITVTVVDCATPHVAEVYLRAPVAVDNAISAVANRECAAGIGSYTGQSVDSGAYSVTYLIDSNQDRTGANPTPSTVICLLQAPNGQLLTGSARH
ncbi:putative lipoprotein lppN [Mycobacterium kansasii]|uniref:Putative lipoprotein lppN n=1 Tax=Mycobacterium kansasii TaxID=1768 RepID=A0A1V3WYQ2_MYCKA|nr:putative lipoprotein lppN [Mycobacterium kansasii]